jgi:RNA polymerase sigma factor (sigma-70 family)
MTTRKARPPEELVESCIMLVHHIARQYATTNSPVTLEDLISEGYIGLVQAAKKYDAHRGVRFSTFATTRIRGAMMDLMRRERPLSRPMEQKVTRFQTLQRELTRDLGRKPTERELALGLDISTAKLREIVRMRAVRVTSLDVQVHELHHEVLDESDSPEDIVVGAMLKRQLHGYLLRLSARDREILRRIYWLHQKQSQVSDELGISISRVSQLQVRALARLRLLLEQDEAESAA